MTSKTERIVEAAIQRFQYYGVAKTTMQEIAQDAQVAVGTLYLYFKNKDDLIVACVAEYVERHRQAIADILAADLPADEKLRRYIVGRYRAADEIRTGSRHAAELTRAALRLQPDRAEEEGLMIWDTTVQILRQGVATGLLQSDTLEADARVFMVSLAFFFPNALSELTIQPTEADLLIVIDWFLQVWKGARAQVGRGSRSRSASAPRRAPAKPSGRRN
ncbi:MAG: TetR/AcrR family transcriptional regulator [Pirellulales bacterium]